MNDFNLNHNARRQFFHQSACGAAAVLAVTRSAQAEPLLTTATEMQEVNRLELSSLSARRIVAAADGVWLAADNSIVKLAANGDCLAKIDLPRPARCLALGKDARQDAVFVGLRDCVVQFNALGDCVWTSPSIGSGHLIGDLQVEPAMLSATDVTSGQRLRLYIDEPEHSWSPVRSAAAIEITAASRLVRHAANRWSITDPARHRVVVLDDAGRTLGSWGRRSREVDGFQGCCNPMAVAELADGSWVTAEAGQVRIKRFDANGQFLQQIAGPDSIAAIATSRDEDPLLRCRVGGIDLAAGPSGDLWVLHAAARQLIHYRPLV